MLLFLTTTYCRARQCQQSEMTEDGAHYRVLDFASAAHGCSSIIDCPWPFEVNETPRPLRCEAMSQVQVSASASEE